MSGNRHYYFIIQGEFPVPTGPLQDLLKHQSDKNFKCLVTRKTFLIRATVNCKTSNVVYVIECLKYKKQYVGESKSALHVRMNGHWLDIKHQCLNKPVAIHFNSEDPPWRIFLFLWLSRSTDRRRTFAKRKKATGFRRSNRWPSRDWNSIHRPLN